MKQQLGIAALAMVASAAAFAQAVPPVSSPITIASNVLDVPCVIMPADAAFTIDFGDVNSKDVAATPQKSVNLKFTGCKGNQFIHLDAKTTRGVAGSGDGRLGLPSGVNDAQGVEIQFDIGATNVHLPVNGGVPVYITKNPLATAGPVAIPLKAKLVTTGAPLADGVIDVDLTLVAGY